MRVGEDLVEFVHVGLGLGGVFLEALLHRRVRWRPCRCQTGRLNQLHVTSKARREWRSLWCLGLWEIEQCGRMAESSVHQRGLVEPKLTIFTKKMAWQKRTLELAPRPQATGTANS